MILRSTTRVLTVVAALAACHSEDPSRAAMRGRLKLEARLTPDEIRQFFQFIAQEIANKKLSATQGALTRALDDQERASVLGLLSEPDAVYDAGMRSMGMTTLRGLKTGATPVLSELDATQTLWIDVDTFVPRRYEFEYSSPGFGDYAYDLSFNP